MWLLEEKLCVMVFVVCVYHMSDMTSGKIACLAFLSVSRLGLFPAATEFMGGATVLSLAWL